MDGENQGKDGKVLSSTAKDCGGENVHCELEKQGNASKVMSQVALSMNHLRSQRDNVEIEEQKKPQPVSKSEEEVGITQYIDSSGGFTGITKYRWSDFVVHEIDTAGNVAVLSDLSIPQEDKITRQEVNRPDWFPESTWESIISLSLSDKKDDSVTIPAAKLTKDDRTKYHVTIKGCFSNLVTNTGEAKGEKVIVVKKANSAPDKKNTFWKHAPWPKGRPKFLHFCLFKENLDTFTALSMLSMDLKLKSNKFHIAGTKDARAKTTQKVAIKQVIAQRVQQAASKFGKLMVGNFSYEDQELKLGDLKGNQFDIVLRHVQGDDDTISRRMASFEKNGFINYYGMQRFGTTSSATHVVGRAIVRKEWRAAVDLLLSGRQEEPGGSMGKAQRAWRAERDPRRAFSLLSGRQQRTTIEGRILHTLCSIRATAYQEAVDRLPSNSRQLYVHAYQSWLWNRLVSRRLAAHGLALRVGDLVLCGDVEPAERTEADAEADASLVDEETAVADGAAAALSRLPEVRALTEADLAHHSIDELVMPLPGWAVRLPGNEVAGWYAELLAADGVDLGRAHCDTMRQYSLAGAYRRVLARPSHVRWRLARYGNPNADLLASDADALRGLAPPADDPATAGGYRALVMQFRLRTSCYATMALRELTGMDSSLAAQMALTAAYNDEMRRRKAGQVAGAAGNGPAGAAADATPPASGADGDSSLTKTDVVKAVTDGKESAPSGNALPSAPIPQESAPSGKESAHSVEALPSVPVAQEPAPFGKESAPSGEAAPSVPAAQESTPSVDAAASRGSPTANGEAVALSVEAGCSAPHGDAASQRVEKRTLADEDEGKETKKQKT